MPNRLPWLTPVDMEARKVRARALLGPEWEGLVLLSVRDEPGGSLNQRTTLESRFTAAGHSNKLHHQNWP